MTKRLQKELKFSIGEQYGKHEFELDWLKSILDNNLRYEVYQYIGNDKRTIFDLEVHRILLAYNCDFLSGVFYFVKGDNYFKILSEIHVKSSCTRKRSIDSIQISDSNSLLYYTNGKILDNNIIDKFISN